MQLRKKIDSIIAKGNAVYDEDAPDCPESVRFWAFTSGKMAEKEKVSVTGQAKAYVRPTADVVGSLVDVGGLPSASNSAAGGGNLSLSSLMNVVKDAQGGVEAEKPKASKIKDKKEKKGKKVTKEEPDTIEEKKDAARNLSQFWKLTNGFQLASFR